jgi:signal transduction histidine kinase
MNKMPRNSISHRLIVYVLLTQLVLAIGVVSLAIYITRQQLRKSFDAMLHGRAMSVAALVRLSEDQPSRLVFDSLLVPPPVDQKHSDIFQILDSQGNVVASQGWDNSLGAHSGRPGDYWWARYEGNGYRVARLNQIQVLDFEGPSDTPTQKITVIYAASFEETRERLWAMGFITALGTLFLLGIATIATFWTVREGLLPLSHLAASAQQVSVKDWKLNPPEDARSIQELAPLVQSMDAMLAKLQQAFDSQRAFIADAAHELKTPIAVLKSTLQLALQKPREASEYLAELERALDDLARLEMLAHSMLRLARAEQVSASGGHNECPLVDLVESCGSTIERMRPLASQKSVSIEMSDAESARLHADPDDLELVWNNLLDNAIRYSPGGSSVFVSVRRQERYAAVEVRDSGPGVPTEELDLIFERFRRSDASRSRDTGGYGLGLAMVKAMVESYGGLVTATSANGGGMKMIVQLPLPS